ncbi:MAG: RidA family protein [Dysgonamonadaceae bacterium]|jgi:2-iminobutanoate/2-iminopropanoate deaminase|nr:RidA family protein [Dysgonamonadaceae bacterium]
MKQVIATSNAPAAIGPYSQAVKAGNFVFLSGQLGINPETGEFVSASVAGQTGQIFSNIKAVLAEAGLTLDHVVKTMVFLADIAAFAEMNEVYARHFNEPYPARSAFAVKTLPKNALVEIEVIAAID